MKKTFFWAGLTLFCVVASAGAVTVEELTQLVEAEASDALIIDVLKADDFKMEVTEVMPDAKL